LHQLQALISDRKWAKIALDAIAIMLSFFVALAIRFEFAIPDQYLSHFLWALPALTLLLLVVNYIMRIYSGQWKYASFDELWSLATAAILSTAISFLAVLLIPSFRTYLPVSIPVIGGILALASMAFIRLQFRFIGERRLRRSSDGSTRVLLFGAGETGEMIARDILRHPEYDYFPVGFVDDDPAKSNMIITGFPVLGGRDDVPGIVTEYDVDEIFITIPSASGEQLREILPFCQQTTAQIKLLPGVVCTMAGKMGVEAIRELRLEDLLGREPVETDIASISEYVAGRVVLVTGAGGSIGSELSQQLSCLDPRKLVLLDNDSTHLYDLDMDLSFRDNMCPREIVVADIRDAKRLEAIFRRHRPRVVFHSAALKHVPLMESHPSEAVKSNVMGTRNLANLACKYGVERFILVSTDKAVQPANVMGATKLLAEQLITHSNGTNGTQFAAVRFGNVLGSRGSVVPFFKKQIESGGPVTITHPEVERFFMTIEEASRLVIQAGAYTEGGDVFILDMGKPVRIIDLANEMIRLLGRGEEIEISISELRPGDRLKEKLLFESEEMLPTPHPKIFKTVHGFEIPYDFQALIDELIRAAERDDEEEIRALLSGMLPSHSLRSGAQAPRAPLKIVPPKPAPGSYSTPSEADRTFSKNKTIL